jgi:hypothetical protein
MSICCPKSIKGLAIRVTRTDVCGDPEPIAQAQSRIQTNGFVSLTLTPNIEDGEEVTVKNADGSFCIVDEDPDLLRGFDLEMLLCGVPTPLLEMLLGASVLNDGADIVGGVLPSKASQSTQANTTAKQLEVWSRNKEGDSCSAGTTTRPYVQWLLPLTRNWNLGGSLEFAVGALEVTVAGFGEEAPGYSPSVSAEWSGAQVTAIRNGGPLAWKCVTTLPETDDCGYVPAGSGS